jgi:hypothetical protein
MRLEKRAPITELTLSAQQLPLRFFCESDIDTLSPQGKTSDQRSSKGQAVFQQLHVNLPNQPVEPQWDPFQPQGYSTPVQRLRQSSSA